MAISPKDNEYFMEHIQKSMEEGLKKVIAKKFDDLKDKFLVELEREKDNEISAMTLHLMKMVDSQTMSDRLIITVKKEDLLTHINE